MLFLTIILAIGLIARRTRRYWAYSYVAVAMQILSYILLSGGGSIENPEKDGYLTRLIVRGPAEPFIVLPWFAMAMFTGWAMPIWLVRRGYKIPPQDSETAWLDRAFRFITEPLQRSTWFLWFSWLQIAVVVVINVLFVSAGIGMRSAQINFIIP